MALGGGALNDAGAYCVHASRMVFGAEPLAISATLDSGDQPVDIHGAALFDFLLREIPDVVSQLPCVCCSEVLEGCYQGACPPS